MGFSLLISNIPHLLARQEHLQLLVHECRRIRVDGSNQQDDLVSAVDSGKCGPDRGNGLGTDEGNSERSRAAPSEGNINHLRESAVSGADSQWGST